MIFLEEAYIFLLILHTLMCFILVGSMSHNLLCLVGYVKGKFGRQKAELKYLKITLIAYAITYLFGALIYPAFRVYIRGGIFDTQMPWATGLFEVKEHWGAVALAILAACYYIRRNFDPQQERAKLFLYIPLCVIVNIVVWYKIVVGIWLTALKGTL